MALTPADLFEAWSGITGSLRLRVEWRDEQGNVIRRRDINVAKVEYDQQAGAVKLYSATASVPSDAKTVYVRIGLSYAGRTFDIVNVGELTAPSPGETGTLVLILAPATATSAQQAQA